MLQPSIEQLINMMRQGRMRGVPKMLMERPVPSQHPQETDDTTEMGMLTWHVRSQWFCTHGRYKEAYDSRMKSIDVLLPQSSQGLIGPQRPHMLPLLRCFLISLRDICEKIDQEVKGTAAEADVTYVEKFVKTVSSLYAAIKNDDERSFACICLYIIGWQCAYKLNQTTVVSKWQLPGMFDLQYKLSDEVTSRYWSGLVFFSKNKWTEAVHHLSYSFHKTPPRFHRHRKIVLYLLIPAKLACCLSKQGEGAIPSTTLLTKYGLHELAGLVAAFQKGNVREFERNLEVHEAFYVRKKIFLQLTKLRLLLYRNLIKLSYEIFLAESKKQQGSAIRISHLLAAVRVGGWDVDESELECVVGLLIKRDYMNAQLTHQHGGLVMFSKSRAAFPRAL